jgi:hypothetical protein
MCRYSLFLAAGAKISWIDQQPDVDPSSDKTNGKIQLGEQIKLPTTFVIGKRDMDALVCRSHSGSGFAGQRRAALVNAQT